MKRQILFSGKNKKNINNLSPAELSQRVVKISPKFEKKKKSMFCDNWYTEMKDHVKPEISMQTLLSKLGLISPRPTHGSQRLKMYFQNLRSATIQIRLRIRAVWSESSLGPFWIAKDAKFLRADNEHWSDQTARICRSIWVFAGSTCQKIRFLSFRLIYIFAQTAKATGWCRTRNTLCPNLDPSWTLSNRGFWVC